MNRSVAFSKTAEVPAPVGVFLLTNRDPVGNFVARQRCAVADVTQHLRICTECRKLVEIGGHKVAGIEAGCFNNGLHSGQCLSASIRFHVKVQSSQRKSKHVLLGAMDRGCYSL